jgi:hypothetical protein
LRRSYGRADRRECDRKFLAPDPHEDAPIACDGVRNFREKAALPDPGFTRDRDDGSLARARRSCVYVHDVAQLFVSAREFFEEDGRADHDLRASAASLST